jgi:hypothetical protein
MTTRGRSNPVVPVPHTVTTEVVLGRRHYVATYADDPTIAFRAASADEAVNQLTHYMAELHALMTGLRYPGAPAPRPGRAPIGPR